MYIGVRSEFDNFVKNLNIDHQDFYIVGMHQYESILTAIVEKFTIRGRKSLRDL